MEGRSGSAGGSRSRLWVFLGIAAAIVLALFGLCTRSARQISQLDVRGDTLPIPAPPRAFGDDAPSGDYLAYGRTLSFATDDPVSAITRHATGDSVSRIRISPETRLLTTPDSAFDVGRIIARIQTDSGTSPYGTPIGLSYLWIRRLGPENYRAQIITDEPLIPSFGRILAVPAFYHVPIDPSLRLDTFCVTLDSLVAGTCCRCYSGCWNAWPRPISFPEVEALVRTIVR